MLSMKPVGFSLVLATSVLLFSPLTAAPPNATGNSAAGDSASVAELSAMLQAIDAYRPSSEASSTIRVFGSSSMDALAHGWAQGFTEFHPKAKVEVYGFGSEGAFEKLVEFPNSIAMLSRPVMDEELQELKKLGLKDPVAFTVAREALAVFVHSSNPVSSISGQQLRTIFTTAQPAGSITWKLMGSVGKFEAQPIHVISRTENCGTQKYLKDFVFHSSEMRDGVSTHTSNAEVLVAVAQDPLGIAICGMRSKGDSVKMLQLMAGDTVVPSDDQAVLSGQYPLTRPLTLVVDMGSRTAAALATQEFVRYALCRAGQSQAIMVGFFPVDLPLLRASIQRLGDSQLR